MSLWLKALHLFILQTEREVGLFSAVWQHPAGDGWEVQLQTCPCPPYITTNRQPPFDSKCQLFKRGGILLPGSGQSAQMLSFIFIFDLSRWEKTNPVPCTDQDDPGKGLCQGLNFLNAAISNHMTSTNEDIALSYLLSCGLLRVDPHFSPAE